MRIRSILLSTVLTLSAMGSGQVFAAASSPAASSIKPQGDWAVTKVESKQGSTPYCALARRFSNGSIVTFARNAKNETSFAMDFPPGSFQTSQNYTVVLNPGAGEDRSYKTQPISGRGMIIRMGRDDNFYQALEKTGKLSVAVDDKSYSFAMADIKSGTSDLSACLSNAVQPAAGEANNDSPAASMRKTEQMAEAVMPTRVPPPPGSSAIPVADGEAQGLKEENIRLRNALEKERRDYEDKMQQANGSSTAAELNEKIQILAAENTQLKNKVAGAAGSLVPDVGTIVPRGGSSDAMQVENDRLKSEMESVKQKMAAMEQDGKSSATMRAENAQLKSDLEAAKQKMAANDTGSTPAVALQNENAQLKADLETAKLKVATQDANEKALAALKAENVQMKSALDNTKQKTASVDGAGKTASPLQAENTQLKTDLDAMSLKMVAIQSENKASLALHAENDQLKAALATMQVKAGTVDSSDKSMAAMKAENTQLKAELDAAKPKLAADDVGAKAMTALQAENAKLKTDLQAAKQQTASSQGQGDKDVLALRTENAQLKSDLDSAKQKASAMEIAQKTFVNDKPLSPDRIDPLVKVLKDQVAKLQSENSELQLAAANVKPAVNVAPAAPAVDVASLARLHAMEEELSVAKADRDRLAAQIEKSKLVPTGPNTSLASSNWDLEQATKRYNEAEHEVSRMASVVDAERAKCTVEKKSIEYMLFDPKIASKEQQAKLMSLENELADAKKGIDGDKDKTIADLKQQVSILQSRNPSQTMAQIAPSSGTPSMSAAMPPAMPVAAVVSSPLPPSSMAPMPAPAKVAQTPLMPSVQRVMPNANPNAGMSDHDAIAQSLASIRPTSGGKAATTMTARVPTAPDASAVDSSVEVSKDALNMSAPMPSMPVAPVMSAPVQSMAAAVQPTKSGLMAATDVSNLLSQSGVNVTGRVLPVPSSTGPGRVAYRWQTEGIMGTVEQKSMENPKQFSNFVQAYLDKTKSRCKGEFAAMPGVANTSGGMNTSVYEIACVDGKAGTGASAALVFYSQGSTFTTIAHETSSDSMDVAMDVRDKIVAALDNGMQTASR